jgi:2-polyprenyl-6-methoxyphenol hydroxylase-like FAD-dependent oxidoreductase
MDTQVLIVGAGPVGLTLAIDLGRRGISCTLVEKNDAPLGYPKMERCNPRTMEIFRRLGLAERIRAAGYPPDWPLDVYLIFDLMRPPVYKMPYPSVAEAKAKRDAVNDGSMPLEPYQIISQYTLEPLLKAEAESIPLIDVKFGHALIEFDQDADGVTATLRKTNGETMPIRAQYLVGCDGASSAVRKQLGIAMTGEPHIREMRQALFYCPALYEKTLAPPARHYHRIDDHWTLLIVQDSRKHFTVHAIVETDDEMPRLFEEILGTKIPYEMLHCAKWTQRLLLADSYGRSRVFIAGDAAHLVIPTGGLGMNTGVGDAIDLSWKLAATLEGWGGPNLLGSYEIERRQVGARNVAASGAGTRGRATWRAEYRPGIDRDTVEGKTALKRLLDVAAAQAPIANRILGAELGYRYDGSPVIVDEPGAPPHLIETYQPSSWPGSRLPHVWIKRGVVSVNDIIPDGYTLLRLAPSKAGEDALARAFAKIGAPFRVVDISSEAARAVFGFDYILVRPDLHVVWRGNAPPADAVGVAKIVSGH